MPSTAWHPEFVDVNNDGFIDLFVSKGNVSAMPDYAQKDPSELLLGQPGGTFVPAAEAAGIVTFDRGRGAAVALASAFALTQVVADCGPDLADAAERGLSRTVVLSHAFQHATRSTNAVR